MMSLGKKLTKADKNVRKGEMGFKETNVLREINFKKLFIIGMGRIGQEIAKRAHVFNMTVYGYDPNISKEEMESFGARKVESLNDGLEVADFITLHVPLNNATSNLISFQQFRMMKSSVFIVNVSRGGVVNEQALSEALKENRIAGAAIDVFMEEPINKGIDFVRLDNTLLTPHTAGVTIESKIRSAKTLVNDTYRAMEGVVPIHLVNHSVLNNTKFLKDN